MKFHSVYAIITVIVSFLLYIQCGKFKPVSIDISLGADKEADSEDKIRFNFIPATNIGYILYDIDKKTIVKSHNPSLAFIPASTTKIATTVAALNNLGPDYRFITSLCYIGSIKNGILSGDLYLKGTGDPLLTVSDLMSMVDALEVKGVRSITGHFYFDESDLPSASSIDNDMEPDVSFNSGISALSLEYNAVNVEWKREKKTETTSVFLVPALPINRVEISQKQLSPHIKFLYRSLDGKETWFLSLDENKDGTERLPIKNPALYTAHMFAKVCEMRGITLARPEPGIMPSDVDEIVIHAGMPLSDLVDLTLTYSINIMAELMMLKTAREMTGKAIKLDDSARMISRYFSDEIPSIKWNKFNIVNGSGLTVKNRITPQQMVAILLFANAQTYKGKKFRSFLPASGWEWSLINRFNDPDTAFHVWAKTGSINYALALAGYLFTKSHRSMAFVIFINDVAERSLYDSDPDRRSAPSMSRVYSWHNNSKKVMDGIISDWIKEL